MDILKVDTAKESVLAGLPKSAKNAILEDSQAGEIFQKTELKEFSIKTLFDSLFKDLTTGVKSKDTVLQILKENNITSSIKDTIVELKSLTNSLKNSKISTKTLDGLLLNIEKLDGKGLEEQIKNSGIFLESKLSKKEPQMGFKNEEVALSQKDDITKDIKANLLHIKDELAKSDSVLAKDMMPRIDKVLVNINYYQLLSYSMGANMLYLPLLWDGLEEGQVSIKKLKQKRFFCEINLKLKDFGKIDLLIMLFDDININISIFTQNDEFLSRIRENLQFLRQGISSVGLVSSNIYLFDSLRDEKIKKETQSYAKTQQIGTGISLHV